MQRRYPSSCERALESYLDSLSHLRATSVDNCGPISLTATQLTQNSIGNKLPSTDSTPTTSFSTITATDRVIGPILLNSARANTGAVSILTLPRRCSSHEQASTYSPKSGARASIEQISASSSCRYAWLSSLPWEYWCDGSSGASGRPRESRKLRISPTLRRRSSIKNLRRNNSAPTLVSEAQPPAIAETLRDKDVSTPSKSSSQDYPPSCSGQASGERVRSGSSDEPQRESSITVDQILSSPNCKATRRRCVDGDAALQAHKHFTAPDRYVSRWPPHNQRNSFHVSRPPASLSPRERYSRRRDDSIDPFRSVSEYHSRYVEIRPQVGPRTGVAYHVPAFVNGVDATPAHIDTQTSVTRQVSAGSVWNVGGGLGPRSVQISAVDDGFGALLASGTNAPMHVAHFSNKESIDDQSRGHESRLALALELDQAERIITGYSSPTARTPTRYTSWQDGAWNSTRRIRSPHKQRQDTSDRVVPSTPYRVLDAPNLKDDYYCSVLAYSYTCRTLAVALQHKVYLWTEDTGVSYPPIPLAQPTNFVTSLSFSSTEGGKSILAVGRHSGHLQLFSLFEHRVRFEVFHANSVSCVSFKPLIASRASESISNFEVSCEDLLVGDDIGTVFLYSVEWPDPSSISRIAGYQGHITLLVKISAHSQNVCGLAWAPGGQHFASGGNDNTALIFDTQEVLETAARDHEEQRGRSPRRHQMSADTVQITGHESNLTPPISPERIYIAGTHDLEGFFVDEITPLPPVSPPVPRLTFRRMQPSPAGLAPTPHHLQTPPSSPERLPPNYHFLPHFLDTTNLVHMPAHNRLHKHVFYHSAAVKALAFAPWQPTLLATGGGSNDRQIHFHHTVSGATLAIINVFAQVTSLVWSKTRREIAATFGYADPRHEHGVRVAVFGWPDGECRVSIKWERKNENGGTNGVGGEYPRALWAISFPGGPNDGVRGGVRRGMSSSPHPSLPRLPEGEAVRGGRRQRRSTAPSPDPADARRGRPRTRARVEGEMWGSRTEEEGSLIIAGCDQTVKFFEVWAGSSKGGRKGRGLGSVRGVLGGSSILEEICAGIDAEHGGEVIR